ncbi:MAG: dihydrodipicolinate synthase family protein [Terriglobia bacterium]
MNAAAMKLEGVFPPLTTPFAADESLDLAALRANIEKYNRTKLAGYVVVGSTGESVSLREEEKSTVWEAARAAAGADKVLIAGTGCEATRETIALTRRAAGLGYQAAVGRTPAYFTGQMPVAALARHFRAVADASPIPILLYSVPQFTGLPLEAPLIARLAEHPNIIGCKESSGNVGRVGDIVRLAPPDFQTLVGSATTFYPSLCLGVVGAVLAVACALPEPCAAVHAAFCQGDHERARRLQRELVEPTVAVTTRYGIAGLKFAMELLGYRGGPPRAPLLPLAAAAQAELRRVFRPFSASA